MLGCWALDFTCWEMALLFLCVFLYFVLGCSWILSGFALKLLVRAREHLSNSTLAKDCANDGMVPSVLLVALFQPQWLTHRLAPTVHYEESESLCLQVCHHCHLSTIFQHLLLCSGLRAASYSFCSVAGGMKIVVELAYTCLSLPDVYWLENHCSITSTSQLFLVFPHER